MTEGRTEGLADGYTHPVSATSAKMVEFSKPFALRKFLQASRKWNFFLFVFKNELCFSLFLSAFSVFFSSLASFFWGLSTCYHHTVGQNNQKYRLEYWATRSSVRSFPRTAHSFACSGLLALLAPSAARTRSLAQGTVNYRKIPNKGPGRFWN